VTFYLLISPWLVGLLTFTLLPIAVSLGISFTRWDMLSPPELVGLRNYARMLDDRLFWQSLSVTARYTLMYVPTELIGGLLLALLMNQVDARGIRLLRTLYYMPSVLSGWRLWWCGCGSSTPRPV
jgi:multiple sugar transport system permease protein